MQLPRLPQHAARGLRQQPPAQLRGTFPHVALPGPVPVHVPVAVAMTYTSTALRRLMQCEENLPCRMGGEAQFCRNCQNMLHDALRVYLRWLMRLKEGV